MTSAVGISNLGGASLHNSFPPYGFNEAELLARPVPDSTWGGTLGEWF